MDKTAATLMAEIVAFEKKLASGARSSRTASRDVVSRRQVLAEIEALERRFAGDDDDADDAGGMDEDIPVTAGDDEGEDAFDAEGAPEEDAGMTASESAPGIEDEITQDRFTEVEDLRHGEELATNPSTANAAGYTARMKEASSRLDRVAEYLERHGRSEMALKLDRIADAIDQQVDEAEDQPLETEEA